MLHFLDFALFAAHLSVIIFNIFGWIWEKTRQAHLIIVGLTLASWLIIGIWKGMGYCFLTDWHWDVKRQLGETDLPNSFVTYLTNNVFQLGISSSTADVITLGAFIPAVALSIFLNIRSYKSQKE